MKKALFAALVLTFIATSCGGGGSGDENSSSTPSPTTSTPEAFNPLSLEGFYSVKQSDCSMNLTDTEVTYLYSGTLEGNKYYYYITAKGIYVIADSNGNEVFFCTYGFENDWCKYNKACAGNDLANQDTWQLICDDSDGELCNATYERS